jgi:hypothetical protein
MHIRLWWKNVKGRYNLGILGIDNRRIILNISQEHRGLF